MSMTLDVPATPSESQRLRTVLIVLAAIQVWSTFSDFPAVFADYGQQSDLIRIAQWITTGYLAVAPVIAVTALVFAIKDRLPQAITALAALILAYWVSELPDIAIHGLELSADVGGITIFWMRFVCPVVALTALVLASRNRRLGLAAFLVSLPMIATGIGVLAFAISVSIYGF